VRRDERGAMAIEVVILTPLLVGAIMVIAAGARYVDSRGQVNNSAYAAARAASLTTNQEAAVQAGTRAAEQSMSQRGFACASLTVSVDAADFNPGGDVRATVTCLADLSDVVGVGAIPGSKAFRFTAAVPLEEHRDFP
jgi:Flp pilus assembly protein TadG